MTPVEKGPYPSGWTPLSLELNSVTDHDLHHVADIPDCTHRLSIRVSSHADLMAAAKSDAPMFSMVCCRGKCRDRARDYIRSLGYEPVEVDW